MRAGERVWGGWCSQCSRRGAAAEPERCSGGAGAVQQRSWSGAAAEELERCVRK